MSAPQGRMSVVWHDLAIDDTFWTTVAGASTALLIAVVVEGRDARERFDQLALKASHRRLKALAEREEEWEAWSKAVEKWHAGEGADPGGPPPLKPIPEDDPETERHVIAQGGRVAGLLLALWTLGGSLLGSLVILLPIRYRGGPLADIGIAVTLGLVIFGACALIWATTRRIQQG